MIVSNIVPRLLELFHTFTRKLPSWGLGGASEENVDYHAWTWGGTKRGWSRQIGPSKE